MISEQQLLECFSKNEYTVEEALAIFQRCLECNDPLLGLIVAKGILIEQIMKRSEVCLPLELST